MNTHDYYSFIKSNIEGMRDFASKDELKDFVVNEVGIPCCVDVTMQILPEVFEDVCEYSFIARGGLARITDAFCKYFGEIIDESVAKEMRKEIHDVVCFHAGETPTVVPGPTCY